MSKGYKKWIVLSILTLVAFITNIDATIVIIALPAMMKSLHLSVVGGNWIITSYLITSTIFLLPSGRWADMIGKKNIFILGVLIFTFATIFCGFSSSIVLLLVSRLIQGIGAAMALSSTMPILIQTFPANQLGSAIALNSTAWIIGSIAGPVIGGFLLLHYSWSYIFWVTVPFGFLAALGAAYLLKSSATSSKKIQNDWLGILTLSIGLSSFLITFSEGQSWGWTSFPTIFLFCLSIISIIAFIKIECWVRVPLLQLSLLKNRKCFINLSLTLTYCIAYFSLPYLLSFYLQGICDFNPQKAALYMIALSLPQLLMGPLGGFLGDSFGSKKILLIGNTILLISILTLTLQLTKFYLVLFIITLLVVSVGNALAWPSLSKIVFSSVPKEQSGTISGIFYTLYNVGRALTQPLSIFAMQFILPEPVLSTIMTKNNYVIQNRLESSATRSLQLAFWLVFAFFCLAMVFSVLPYSAKLKSENVTCKTDRMVR